MTIPSGVFGVQFRHGAAIGAFFQGVLATNVHHHLDMVRLINVQLLTHGPEELILTGRNDAVFKNHLNDVAVILNGRKVSVVQHHTSLFCNDVRTARVIDKNHKRSSVQRVISKFKRNPGPSRFA